MDKIAEATDIDYRPKPPGHLVKFNLQDADLAELVNHISGLTGRRFIYGAKVRQIKATVVSPEPVTLAEAYEAFLSILEANGMTVIPHGRFLKIVDSGGVNNQATPIYSRGDPVPDADRYVTRLYRLKHVGADELAALLTKFKSKEGDISSYAPGQLLIITDTGTQIRRLVRIAEEVDVGGAGQQMWIEPVHYGAASDMAKRINELFELGQGQPGQPGASSRAGGLSKVLADEASNALIVVGTEESYLRLLELLKRLDGPPSESGKIHVLPLQHANAEELANTLTQMLSGAQAGQGRQRGQAANPGDIAELFEGELRVTPDKATNSLIITASGHDYAQLRLVIFDLDQARRQVFIEAVIMDLTVSNSETLGVAFHAGAAPDLGGPGPSLVLGGFDAGKSLAFPTDPSLLQGLAAGIRGPDLEGTDNLLGVPGISIPAFGIVMNALASSGRSNVLATPHVIATDNVPAEISIGDDIPLQENVGGLPNLGALAGAQGQQAGGLNLAGLGGLGFGTSVPRTKVGNKIKVTPHINDENQVRLEIEQESSARGATSGALGVVSIVERTANTTVVVDDQQTVVIGGLTRDEYVTSREKVPVLGDLPVLGFLFRSTRTERRKANLLLILTPTVIRDQNDLRKVFERKMQERQEFLDRYFVFGADDWEPPRDYSRTNGLVEDIRQAYFELDEYARLQEESMPRATRAHEPSPPIDLPQTVRAGGAGAAPATPAPVNPTQPATQPRPQPRRGRTPPTPPQGSLDSPIQINPVARSVNVERVE